MTCVKRSTKESSFLMYALNAKPAENQATLSGHHIRTGSGSDRRIKTGSGSDRCIRTGSGSGQRIRTGSGSDRVTALTLVGMLQRVSPENKTGNITNFFGV